MKQKANASDPAHFKFADLPAELIAAVLHFAEPRSLVPASSRTFSVALAPKFMKHDWLDSILASRVPSAWKTCYVSARGFPGDVGALLEYANGKVVGPDDLRRAGFQYCDPDDERIMASLLPVLANYLLDLAQPAYGSGDDLTQVTATLSNRIDYDLRTNHTRSIRARAEPLLGLMQLIGNLLGSPALQLARDRLPRIFHVKLAIEQWAALVRMVIRYDRLCDPWLQWEVRFGVFLGMHGELRWKRPSLDDLYEPEPGFDLDEDWDYTCLVHRGYVRMLLSDMEINEDNWGSPSGLLFANLPAEPLAAVLHFANPRSLVPATTRAFSEVMALKSLKRDWLNSLLAHRVPVAWKERYVADRGFPGDIGALLDPGHCAPYPVTLVLQEQLSMSGEDCVVTDPSGQVVFEVHGKAMSLHNARRIVDPRTKATLCKASDVHKLITLHVNYEIEDAKGKSVVTVKGRRGITSSKLDVTVNVPGAPHHLYVKFSPLSISTAVRIYVGSSSSGPVIANIRREKSLMSHFLDKDTYRIDIAPGVDGALIVALVMLVDAAREKLT
ncbi:hypothetical protein H9P43_009291 [Blastocladiella emersonii ATCC 22665]|nr:hypothetical protein H9P43_009291 [Blastocladiella emersonii ATCC 22665]